MEQVSFAQNTCENSLLMKCALSVLRFNACAVGAGSAKLMYNESFMVPFLRSINQSTKNVHNIINGSSKIHGSY